MNGKKSFLLVAVFVALFLLIGAGVEVAQAGGIGKTDPTHAPVCQKVLVTARDYYELRCYDRGADLAGVTVNTNGVYKLAWDDRTVSLLVYASPTMNVTASWTVYDKAGNSVSGTLP